MSDADTAYELAREKIAKAARTGALGLWLSGTEFNALDRLPPELSEMSQLREILLIGTKVNDIKPLANLKDLETLGLDGTAVTDISPVRSLIRLGTLGIRNTAVIDFSPLANLKSARMLFLSGTRIADLSHLANLAELTDLEINDTPITDLRPIAWLDRLATDGIWGLTFSETGATRRDAHLEELANSYKEATLQDKIPYAVASAMNSLSLTKTVPVRPIIKQNRKRTRQTLDYLRSLPPWPEPYTPAATADGSPPQPIGGGAAPLDPQATKSQITHLLRNATATRLTAQEFARQIRTALQGVPATDGNKLAEPLQTMLEFADVLDRLAPQSEPATDPLDRAKLELRIAQLETLVARLTRQLHDETTAREAAEALAGKGGFTRSFQQEAGKQVARVVVWVPSVVICTGLYQAATHYLGVGNPVLEGMSRLLLKAGD